MLYSDVDLAYFAAMLEAEGSVCLYWTSPHGYEIATYQVGIVNKDMAILNWINRRFGGRIGSKGNGDKGDCYRWYICNRKELIALLPFVIPFMVGAKKGKAERLLAYLRCRDLRPYGKISNEEVQMVYTFQEGVGGAI